MKLTLRMCFKTEGDLRAALRSFSDERFESNACGIIEGVDFDYDFVDSDDLYSDDGNKKIVPPITEHDCGTSEVYGKPYDPGRKRDCPGRFNPPTVTVPPLNECPLCGTYHGGVGVCVYCESRVPYQR